MVNWKIRHGWVQGQKHRRGRITHVVGRGAGWAMVVVVDWSGSWWWWWFGWGAGGARQGSTMAGLWQHYGRAAAHAFLNPESPDQTFTYAQSSSSPQSQCHHYLHGHRHQYHFKLLPLEIATNVMTQRPRKVLVMQAFQNKHVVTYTPPMPKILCTEA